VDCLHVVDPAICDVYVDRIAALLIASVMFSQTPIAAVARGRCRGRSPRCRDRHAARRGLPVRRRAGVVDGGREAVRDRPGRVGDSDTCAESSAFVAFVFFQKNFA
jgi:hypothetical protein